MSLAYFLARRIHFSKDSESLRVSPPAIRIAVAGIAVGMAVMLLSVAIVIGFKQEITQKVVGFGSHVRVQSMSYNQTFESLPVCVDDTLLMSLRAIPQVRYVQPYTTKPAVLKTPDDFLSVAIKGMPADADWSFFATHLTGGCLPAEERDLLVSQMIADRLHLQVGDQVRLYFVKTGTDADQLAYGAQSTSVKMRQYHVSGIYATYFNECDRQMLVGRIEPLQAVNGWDTDMVSGLEVMFETAGAARIGYPEVVETLSGRTDRRGTAFYAQRIEQYFSQIFAWLDLLDTNVWIILILIALVAAFTMIGGLLIIILERTRMIGILKALGYDNSGLQRVFLYVAFFLIVKGLFWGNLIGLVLCWVQSQWHLVRLDPVHYYMSWVPVSITPWHVVVINLATIALTLLILLAPSAFVARISPTKAIQSE